MPIPTIGNVEITLIKDMLLEPAMVFLIFIMCGLCGLMTGKMQSDKAKANMPGSDPMMLNETLFDWFLDYSYGVAGGILGIPILLGLGWPMFWLPAFGFAGRVLLIKIGNKAEKSIPE